MATLSQKTKKNRKTKELGVSNATRAIWLVKVPNYVATLWRNADPDAELGKMRIAKSVKANETVMSFILSEDLARKGASKAGGLEIPREHNVRMQDASRQALSGFSESVGSVENEVLAEGKVVQRAELQPIDSAAYRKLKQHHFKEAGKTKFSRVIQLDHAPISKPAKNVSKPKQLDKRARDNREMVLNLIFSSFKTHEFYTFKDLVHKTSQPPTYLKEILREVCLYNTRAPHKNMWQLKPEYRHYEKSASS